MFPEYRDLISKLKQEDAHFARLFDEHNELDDKITGLVNNPVTSGAEEIEELKKAKLKLKDELYALLQKAAGKQFKFLRSSETISDDLFVCG